MKYIKLEDAIRAAESCTDTMEPVSHDVAVELVVKKIKALPTTEIVECRECKNFMLLHNDGVYFPLCAMRGMTITNRTGFCDIGKPRADLRADPACAGCPEEKLCHEEATERCERGWEDER